LLVMANVQILLLPRWCLYCVRDWRLLLVLLVLLVLLL
jgi:hypothetical protein